MINHLERNLEDEHPIKILLDEHNKMLEFADQLSIKAKQLKDFGGFNEADQCVQEINQLITHFKDAEKHYLREENVLFPYLEKRGIVEPPAVMWTEHDNIRKIKKQLFSLNKDNNSFDDFTNQIILCADDLAELINLHFMKEDQILFSMALQVIQPDEWPQIKQGFEEIGFCNFTPNVKKPDAQVQDDDFTYDDKPIYMKTGVLDDKTLDAILNTLPVDLTFIDANDTFRYFNQAKDQIFLRTKEAIGRQVQNCHPQKSVHIVNKIIADFRSGEQDVADFYINFEGKYVYIRYFAVRSSSGEYLGAMEVTQDIADIQKIQGEKRLLED
jgi:PAS domain S-box-containing protein